jgi:hypothetical protein
VYRPNRFLRHVLHSNTTRPFTFSSSSRFFSAALGAARSLDGTRPRLRCLTESAKESQHYDNHSTRHIHPMMLLFSLAATCPGQIAASSQLHAGKISNTERSKRAHSSTCSDTWCLTLVLHHNIVVVRFACRVRQRRPCR